MINVKNENGYSKVNETMEKIFEVIKNSQTTRKDLLKEKIAKLGKIYIEMYEALLTRGVLYTEAKECGVNNKTKRPFVKISNKNAIEYALRHNQDVFSVKKMSDKFNYWFYKDNGLEEFSDLKKLDYNFALNEYFNEEMKYSDFEKITSYLFTEMKDFSVETEKKDQTKQSSIKSKTSNKTEVKSPLRIETKSTPKEEKECSIVINFDEQRDPTDVDDIVDEKVVNKQTQVLKTTHKNLHENLPVKKEESNTVKKVSDKNEVCSINCYSEELQECSKKLTNLISMISSNICKRNEALHNCSDKEEYAKHLQKTINDNQKEIYLLQALCENVLTIDNWILDTTED